MKTKQRALTKNERNKVINKLTTYDKLLYKLTIPFFIPLVRISFHDYFNLTIYLLISSLIFLTSTYNIITSALLGYIALIIHNLIIYGFPYTLNHEKTIRSTTLKFFLPFFRLIHNSSDIFLSFFMYYSIIFLLLDPRNTFITALLAWTTICIHKFFLHNLHYTPNPEN